MWRGVADEKVRHGERGGGARRGLREGTKRRFIVWLSSFFQMLWILHVFTAVPLAGVAGF